MSEYDRTDAKQVLAHAAHESLMKKARAAAAFDLEYMREYKRLAAEQGVDAEPPPGRPSDRHLNRRAAGSDSDLDRR